MSNSFKEKCFYRSSNIGAMTIKVIKRTAKTITFENYVDGVADPFNFTEKRQIRINRQGDEYILTDIASISSADCCHPPDYDPVEIIFITGEVK